MMEHAATNADNAPNRSFRRPVVLVCIRHRDLLLDALVFVELLQRVGRRLLDSVMPHKLNLFVETGLDLLDKGREASVTLQLDSQTKTLHALTRFINDQQLEINATK